MGRKTGLIVRREKINGVLDGILEKEETDDIFEVDLDKYVDELLIEEIRPLLRELCYFYMYETRNEKGVPHNEKVTQKILQEKYPKLLKKALRPYSKAGTVARHAKEVADERWDAQFTSRNIVASLAFRDRMLQVRRMMPMLERAIMNGDIGAVQQYVALARFEMEAAGYRAPTKYEFSATTGEELTEQDKAAAIEALEHIKDFDYQMLGDGSDILEGQYETLEETDKNN
jgi:hypothetical protein